MTKPNRLDDHDALQRKRDLFSEVNRLRVFHPRLQQALKLIERCHRFSSREAEPMCLSIVGMTGVGKSTVKETYAAKYPRNSDGAVEHVPVLCATVPEGPTPKTLVETMLRSLGDGAYDKGSTVTKTSRLAAALTACGVEAILLDEFHHFADRNQPKLMYRVADWLKVLISETHIPVVLFGLESCLDVFKQNEQLARRFSSRFILEPFDWDDGQSRQEFRGFLKTVASKLPFRSVPPFHDREFAFRLYVASGGCLGYLMRIIRGAALRAIEDGREVVDQADVERAYVEEVWDAQLQAANSFSDKFNVAKAEEEREHQKARQRFIRKAAAPAPANATAWAALRSRRAA